MTEDNRIPEIRAVLAEIKQARPGERDGYFLAARLAQIVGILDSAPPEQKRPEDWTLDELRGTAEDRVRAVLDAFSVTVADMDRFVTALVRCVPDQPTPPAPRVFFPGDTVPAGVCVRAENGDEYRSRDARILLAGGPYVEVHPMTQEEWQATVDRAKAARADSEWQHTEGVNP